MHWPSTKLCGRGGSGSSLAAGGGSSPRGERELRLSEGDELRFDFKAPVPADRGTFYPLRLSLGDQRDEVERVIESKLSKLTRCELGHERGCASRSRG